ncbi:MAG: sodium ion-translocating decarboxylase subunit beta [Candidatus Wallbacteria bacterium]|nr:sodium ion-translocating decarboxylase subunit beta [Candidatus Wallbacteria bacterium]
MLGVGLLLIYLAVARHFEPLLLLPIGFGALTANIPNNCLTYDGYFYRSDLINSTALISRLNDQNEQFSRYLKRYFSEDLQNKIAVFTGGGTPDVQLELNLLSELNNLLNGPTLFDEDIFKDYQLNPETLKLAHTNLTAEKQFLLNRLLIEEVYPAEIHPGPGKSFGLFYYLYHGVKLVIFPPLIFLGIGAMTDFGPLIANTRIFLLGAATQSGIFITMLCAMLLGFTPREAASIGIIGGADGPVTIFTVAKLAPHLLAPILVAAYSYMALIPLIQPPIMRLLTTSRERMIMMKPLREVSRQERILFPIVVTLVCLYIVPAVSALISMLMLGNLMREAGCAEKLADTARNQLINIVTIFLGTAVGTTMRAETFLNIATLKILALGTVAFSFATAGGILLCKLMNLFGADRINPLIGAAGVSAVPISARVVQKVGQEENPQNFLLMHALGASVSGVIGAAVTAGVLLEMLR